MGSYDQPGFNSPIPGRGQFDAHYDGQTAPGSQVTPPDTFVSASEDLERGTTVDSAVVVAPGASLVTGVRVPVGALDSLVGNQAESYGESKDPLTGIGAFLGETGSGLGTAGHAPHPGARP